MSYSNQLFRLFLDTHCFVVPLSVRSQVSTSTFYTSVSFRRDSFCQQCRPDLASDGTMKILPSKRNGGCKLPERELPQQRSWLDDIHLSNFVDLNSTAFFCQRLSQLNRQLKEGPFIWASRDTGRSPESFCIVASRRFRLQSHFACGRLKCDTANLDPGRTLAVGRHCLRLLPGESTSSDHSRSLIQPLFT